MFCCTVSRAFIRLSSLSVSQTEIYTRVICSTTLSYCLFFRWAFSAFQGNSWNCLWIRELNKIMTHTMNWFPRLGIHTRVILARLARSLRCANYSSLNYFHGGTFQTKTTQNLHLSTAASLRGPIKRQVMFLHRRRFDLCLVASLGKAFNIPSFPYITLRHSILGIITWQKSFVWLFHETHSFTWRLIDDELESDRCITADAKSATTANQGQGEYWRKACSILKPREAYSQNVPSDLSGFCINTVGLQNRKHGGLTHLDEWSGVCPFRNTRDSSASRCSATGTGRLSNRIPLIVILMSFQEKEGGQK